MNCRIQLLISNRYKSNIKKNEFNTYAEKITDIIKESSNLSIGLYGDWGTGKTTLMKEIEKDLNTATQDKEKLFLNFTKLKKGDKIDEIDCNKIKSFLSQYESITINWLDKARKEELNNENVVKFSTGKKNSKFKSVLNKCGFHRDNDIHFLNIKIDSDSAFLEIDDKYFFKFDLLNEQEEQLNKNDITIILENKNYVTIWFDAWRYEKEKGYALTALLKTIAYTLGEHPRYHQVKSLLLNSAQVITKEILTSIATKYVGQYVGNIDFAELREKIYPNMELLSEFDQDTLYFDGLKKIRQELYQIKKTYKDTKIIVFIDDLDRCHPDKILEIFESIKIFLDMEGFVYIMALTQDSVSKLINPEKHGYDGKEYMKKLIQLPINIPKWNEQEIHELIDDYIENKIPEHKNCFSQEKYKNLISEATENNPKKLKQFLDNFSLSLKIFPNLEPKVLLLLEIINNRWPNFYYNLSYLFTSENLKIVKDILKDIFSEVQLQEKQMEKTESSDHFFRYKLEQKELEPDLDQDIKIVLNLIKEHTNLRKFLKKYQEDICNLFDINDNEKLDEYKRAVDTINKDSIIINNEIKKEIAIDILKKPDSREKVYEFNKTRKMYSKQTLHLDGINLSGEDLVGIDFKYSDLSNSDLSRSKLSNSNLLNSSLVNCDFTDSDLSKSTLSYSDLSNSFLIRTNLSNSYMLNTQIVNANFDNSNLSNSDLSGSKISDSHFINTDLSNSDLTYVTFDKVNLSNTDLSNTDLSNSNISNSLIINLKNKNGYNFIVNSKTNFKGSIILDDDLANYLKSFHCKNVEVIKNHELAEKLKQNPSLLDLNNMQIEEHDIPNYVNNLLNSEKLISNISN